MKRELAPASADDARSLLLIPLVRAERAWGHAMEIKQEVAGPGKVKHALRKRRRMLRRMAKATESALELARLAAGCGDPRTVLEAAAYAAWMRGARLVEQETNWEGALRAFEEARRAFEELARAGSAADEAVFLEVRGGKDKLIEPGTDADLAANGVEKFITAPNKVTYTFFVNGKAYETDKKKLTGAQRAPRLSTSTVRDPASRTVFSCLQAGGGPCSRKS